MSNMTTIMGVIVLIIGVLGVFGWVYAYMQISNDLLTLAQAESATRSASSIPFIGGLISGITTPTADVIYSIRTTITLFFFYNILVNIALVFGGIGLVSIGRNILYVNSSVTKIRKYLLKKKEENEAK